VSQSNPTEIAAFGDDINDMEMLQNCGVGVAMANGLDRVKAAADWVCDTNDQDGVAKWLVERLGIEPPSCDTLGGQTIMP
jgi:hydroxymethylpyrimidine pyrophosphatase-like HAD family hydrolase